jgi:hypothetical protein
MGKPEKQLSNDLYTDVDNKEAAAFYAGILALGSIVFMIFVILCLKFYAKRMYGPGLARNCFRSYCLCLFDTKPCPAIAAIAVALPLVALFTYQFAIIMVDTNDYITNKQAPAETGFQPVPECATTGGGAAGTPYALDCPFGFVDACPHGCKLYSGLLSTWCVLILLVFFYFYAILQSLHLDQQMWKHQPEETNMYCPITALPATRKCKVCHCSVSYAGMRGTLGRLVGDDLSNGKFPDSMFWLSRERTPMFGKAFEFFVDPTTEADEDDANDDTEEEEGVEYIVPEKVRYASACMACRTVYSAQNPLASYDPLMMMIIAIVVLVLGRRVLVFAYVGSLLILLAGLVLLGRFWRKIVRCYMFEAHFQLMRNRIEVIKKERQLQPLPSPSQRDYSQAVLSDA